MSQFTDSYIKYYKIIEEARTLDRSRKDKEYYEEHHIIPKSLGGSNKKSNLVLLTPEEHYICHSLLPDFCEGEARQKMSFAWNALRCLSKVDGEKISGPEKYGELRREFVKFITGGNSPRAKEIYQVDPKNGKLLKIWDCIQTAIHEYGGNIYTCVLGTTKTASNFIWMIPEDYTEERIIQIQNTVYGKGGINSPHKRSVYKINTTTLEVEGKWPLIKNASLDSGVGRACISACANGRQKTAGGYFWVYEENYKDWLASK